MTAVAGTPYFEDRDRFIEIWRGISVFLVVYFHLSARVTPDALQTADYPIVVNHIGKIGVYIFFIISAFLIARSLEGCKSAAEFFAKRISRIWPLFAAACILIFLFMRILPPPVVLEGQNRFNTAPARWIDVFGSILFLKDFGFRWVDGAFWSILVELKFYMFVCLFAAYFRRDYIKKFCIAAIILNSSSVVIEIFHRRNMFDPDLMHSLQTVDKILNGIFIAKYLQFFAVGLAFYQRRFDGLFPVLVGLCIIDAFVAISEDRIFEATANIIFIFILCLALLIDHFFVDNGIALWFGRYSYSLYLFHQMIGLGIMRALTPQIGINMALIAAWTVVILISWAMSCLFEWRYRRPVFAVLFRFFSVAGLAKGSLILPFSSSIDKNIRADPKRG